MYIHVNLGNVFVYLVIYFMGEIPGSLPSKWKVMTWPTTVSCVPMFVHVHNYVYMYIHSHICIKAMLCITHAYLCSQWVYDGYPVSCTTLHWYCYLLIYCCLLLLHNVSFSAFCDLYFCIMLPDWLFLCILYSEKLSRGKDFMDLVVSEPSFFVRNFRNTPTAPTCIWLV